MKSSRSWTSAPGCTAGRPGGALAPGGGCLEAAERYAKGMQDEYVSTEHILLGLTESTEGKRLSQYGLTKDAILKALASVRGSQRVTSRLRKIPTRRWRNTGAT